MTERPTAIVTGAAGGIGTASSVELAKRGYDLTVVDLDAERLEAVEKQVREVGGAALALAGDLADLAFVERIVPETVAAHGRIDLLVNNAAWRDLVTTRTVSVDSWERTLRVGLTVPALLAKQAAAIMKRQGAGVIVNISSIQADMAGGYAAAYVASKGGLDSLTFDLAAEYGRSGIRVIAIRPGAIDTDMNRTFREPSGASVSEQVMAFAADMIPLGRQGRPEEIARTVAWLASDEASYITGTTITVDGGWSTQINPYSLKRLMFPEDYE